MKIKSIFDWSLLSKFLFAVIVALILMVATFAIAQTTNNLSVVLAPGQDSALKSSWIYDTQLRTNGIAPYTNGTPAQTFKQFVEGVAATALTQKVQDIQAQRESEMLVLWRAATPAKQKAALQALQ